MRHRLSWLRIRNTANGKVSPDEPIAGPVEQMDADPRTGLIDRPERRIACDTKAQRGQLSSRRPARSCKRKAVRGQRLAVLSFRSGGSVIMMRTKVRD